MKPAKNIPNPDFNKYGLETWNKHEWLESCPMRCKHCGVPIGIGHDNFCVREMPKVTTGPEPDEK